MKFMFLRYITFSMFKIMHPSPTFHFCFFVLFPPLHTSSPSCLPAPFSPSLPCPGLPSSFPPFLLPSPCRLYCATCPAFKIFYFFLLFWDSLAKLLRLDSNLPSCLSLPECKDYHAWVSRTFFSPAKPYILPTYIVPCSFSPWQLLFYLCSRFICSRAAEIA